MYGKHAGSRAQSAKREEKREDLHRPYYKSFGCMKLYVQRIFYREDMFGMPCYKLVKHAVAD